jgi:hypothetical protein
VGLESLKLSATELNKLRAALPTMPEKQKRRTAELLKKYKEEVNREISKDSFLDFRKTRLSGLQSGAAPL